MNELNKKNGNVVLLIAIAILALLLNASLVVATTKEDVKNIAMHAFDKDSVNGNRVNIKGYGNWNWLESVPKLII